MLCVTFWVLAEPGHTVQIGNRLTGYSRNQGRLVWAPASPGVITYMLGHTKQTFCMQPKPLFSLVDQPTNLLSLPSPLK